MKKIRKKYSKQFKIDAVNLVLKQGFNAVEAARNLDINENLLRRWMRKMLVVLETLQPNYLETVKLLL